MPDQFGFDHLPRNGSIEVRCIWCSHQARPGASEGSLRRHQRSHRKDVEAAMAAGRRERETVQAVQDAIAV